MKLIAYHRAMDKTGVHVLKKKLQTISHHAGVYRMLDSNGKVLYVGKAKDLHNRLTNYTHLDGLSHRIWTMVEKIADVITVETAGEQEALLLENELIKRYRPPYNILLKDDKSFPYIILTKDPYPRMMKYRGTRSLKGHYFGPFSSGLAVQETLKYLQKAFQIRTCTNSYFSNRSRPCLLHQIGLCSAPCVGIISEKTYQENIRKAIAFMNGTDNSLCSHLQQEMEEASTQLHYEEAAVLRDQLWALNKIRGQGDYTPLFDTDVIGLFKEGDKACVQVFFYRHGSTNGTAAYVLADVADTPEEDILGTFLLQFYQDVPAPKTILISCPLSVTTNQALTTLAGHTLLIQSLHLRGRKKELIEEARKNAKQTLHQKLTEQGVSHQLWEAFQNLMGIPELNKIEVYDNSHFQGAAATGAMIALTEEGFQKKLYRRYNIRLSATNDDFGMMREVLKRRIVRGRAEKDLPSVFIIDGGKGQLSAVQEILEELNETSVAVLAVAKGPDRNAGHEVLYKLGETDPIHLPYKDPLLYFIQRIRDEAHRFAIGTHRAKRQKAMIPDLLGEIEGIGEKRKHDLLHYFGSVREIKGASVKDLKRVPGISQELAEKIVDFFHG